MAVSWPSEHVYVAESPNTPDVVVVVAWLADGSESHTRLEHVTSSVESQLQLALTDRIVVSGASCVPVVVYPSRHTYVTAVPNIPLAASRVATDAVEKLGAAPQFFGLHWTSATDENSQSELTERSALLELTIDPSDPSTVCPATHGYDTTWPNVIVRRDLLDTVAAWKSGVLPHCLAWHDCTVCQEPLARQAIENDSGPVLTPLVEKPVVHTYKAD
jgi:hypothetical protein